MILFIRCEVAFLSYFDFEMVSAPLNLYISEAAGRRTQILSTEAPTTAVLPMRHLAVTLHAGFVAN